MSSSNLINFSQLSLAWVVFTLGGIILTLGVNLFFPQHLVLGNEYSSPLMAAFSSMAMVSLLGVGMMPIIETIAANKKWKLESVHWLFIYWVINALSLWIVGRFALVMGLGLKAWWVAILFGLGLDLIQGGLMKEIVSKVK